MGCKQTCRHWLWYQEAPDYSSRWLVTPHQSVRATLFNFFIEDEKVSTDELQEKIAEFEDYVQSTDIAAMQSTCLPCSPYAVPYLRPQSCEHQRRCWLLVSLLRISTVICIVE